MGGFLTFLAGGAAAVAVLAWRKPAVSRTERSIVVDAPVDAVFAEVNDFKKWDAWSPWAKIDPAAVTNFTGADSGEGAVMRWSGNAKVGSGSLTIIESRPGQEINMRLDFEKPFKSSDTCRFAFAQQPQGKTLVVWSMQTQNDKFLKKIMGVVFDCEKMIGEKYEEGLATLKAVAEGKKA
jgi:hypothetical protein